MDLGHFLKGKSVDSMSLVSTLRSLPSLMLVGMIRGYQRIVSPHMPASCRFVPTCSEYSIQALRKYGLFKGIVLSVHRVLRCHPWGGHGYDPPVWYSEREESTDVDSRSHTIG